MQREALANKAVYFVRLGAKGVSEKAPEADIAIGMVPTGALDAFRALMAELYLPILTEAGSWGRSTEKQTHAFLKAILASCMLHLHDLASMLMFI